MAKGDSENNIWEFNCMKYCGGEWRRVGKSSYNRHAPYQEADQAMIVGIGQEDISARDMEEQGEMEDDFLMDLRLGHWYVVISVGEPGEEEPLDDLSENEQEKDEEDEEEGEEEEEEECDGEKENMDELAANLLLADEPLCRLSC
ncbi:hypothetical protein BT69DRAFT_1314981 [Atractiella rhizophila]|nr:hypothetical protein BT69DRAFT_1314981 [Atractiella rhizophila]